MPSPWPAPDLPPHLCTVTKPRATCVWVGAREALDLGEQELTGEWGARGRAGASLLKSPKVLRYFAVLSGRDTPDSGRSSRCVWPHIFLTS